MLLQVTKRKTIPLKGLSLYLGKNWLDVSKKILDTLFWGIIGINKNIFSSFTQKGTTGHQTMQQVLLYLEISLVS